jgi:hypothetical protein
MTAQDWLPGLDDREEQSEAAPTLRRRRVLAGAGALATVVALTAVVAVVQGLTTARPDASGSTAASPSAATGTTAARPQPAPVVIQAGLADPAIAGGGGIGPLVVGTLPVRGGVAPERVPNFDSCGADRAALQYLPVQISLPADYLSATFEVRTTASTPSSIGRLGFFFQAGRESTPCTDGAWPTSDSFLANLHQAHITGYVVLDQAFTPSTPQGRPDVFGTLELRVSDIRLSGRPATVSAPTIGSLCPGTQNELCAALG